MYPLPSTTYYPNAKAHVADLVAKGKPPPNLEDLKKQIFTSHEERFEAMNKVAARSHQWKPGELEKEIDTLNTEVARWYAWYSLECGRDIDLPTLSFPAPDTKQQITQMLFVM